MLNFWFLSIFSVLMFVGALEDAKTRRIDIFVLLGMSLVAGNGLLGIDSVEFWNRTFLASVMLLVSLFFFIKQGALQGDYIIYALLVWFLGGDLGGGVVVLSGLLMLLFNFSMNNYKLEKKVFVLEQPAVPFIFLSLLPVLVYAFELLGV